MSKKSTGISLNAFAGNLVLPGVEFPIRNASVNFKVNLESLSFHAVFKRKNDSVRFIKHLRRFPHYIYGRYDTEKHPSFLFMFTPQDYSILESLDYSTISIDGRKASIYIPTGRESWKRKALEGRND